MKVIFSDLCAEITALRTIFLPDDEILHT